jgi:hypothetical protein
VALVPTLRHQSGAHCRLGHLVSDLKPTVIGRGRLQFSAAHDATPCGAPPAHVPVRGLSEPY